MKRLAILAALAVATPALADPCTAIPDRGALPAYLKAGKPFSGPVVYNGDGDGLCVEVGSLQKMQTTPGSTWVEVRIADFDASELNEPGGREAKAALSSIALGKPAVCVPQRGRNGRIDTYDRVVARCTINGVSVGDLMRGAGVREGGRGR